MGVLFAAAAVTSSSPAYAQFHSAAAERPHFVLPGYLVGAGAGAGGVGAAHAPWRRVSFDASVPQAPDGAVAPQTPSPRPRAFVYSDAYRTRAKIHRYASFATLPLFGAMAAVGQSLYNDPSGGKKNLHLALATGMGALFTVNSVTGVWNLIEARKDPHGRTRRWIHGGLLLAADAGFLATAATGPESEHEGPGPFRQEGSPTLHRAMAFTSIGLATAGYLVMLFGGR